MELGIPAAVLAPGLVDNHRKKEATEGDFYRCFYHKHKYCNGRIQQPASEAIH